MAGSEAFCSVGILLRSFLSRLERTARQLHFRYNLGLDTKGEAGKDAKEERAVVIRLQLHGRRKDDLNKVIHGSIEVITFTQGDKYGGDCIGSKVLHSLESPRSSWGN